MQKENTLTAGQWFDRWFMTTTKWNGYRNLTATKMCLQAPKLAHKMCS